MSINQPQVPARTFKILGLFLNYPSCQWLDHAPELIALLRSENLVTREDLTATSQLARGLSSADIYEIQENYVDSFDRVSSQSLHLFEHVHGVNRDRGQAMVDLLDRYAEAGLNLEARELPDYLPVFLEYLSCLPLSQALEDLKEVAPILKALGKRLHERASPYHVLFDALVRLTGQQPEKIGRIHHVPLPKGEALDREWEEQPIQFLDAGNPTAGCHGSSASASAACGCDGITTSAAILPGILNSPSTQLAKNSAA